MKTGTDFGTNSMSYDSMLEIEFKLLNGQSLYFCGHGTEDDGAVVS